MCYSVLCFASYLPDQVEAHRHTCPPNSSAVRIWAADHPGFGLVVAERLDVSFRRGGLPAADLGTMEHRPRPDLAVLRRLRIFAARIVVVHKQSMRVGRMVRVRRLQVRVHDLALET